MKKKIYIKTFGCQMNEYDSNRILDITKKINYFSTNESSEADCYLINTCHIREKATDKVFHDIGRVKKLFRNKRKPILIISGCVAQAEGDLILKEEKYVDAVIGPQSYHLINDIIKKLEIKNTQIEKTNFEVIKKFDELRLVKNTNSKISSFLTIQEGCDKFCKFCVVPYTRGPEHSRSFDDILNEAKNLVSNGSREITLLGQNVNAYQKDNKRISDIIYELQKINGLKRIRYTTSHPKDMTNDLIDAHKDCEKLMPLLHLPVQSGSNKILLSMNRKHTIEEFKETILKLRSKNPKIKFTSDFIIAYPGEKNEDFISTCNLMKNIKFISSYSFIFSSRPGTPSSQLKNIENKIAKERLIIFQKIAKKIKIQYKRSLLGKKVRALFENKISDKMYFGRDEFHNSVIVKSENNIIGEIKDVSILNYNQQTLFGEIIMKNNNIAA